MVRYVYPGLDVVPDDDGAQVADACGDGDAELEAVRRASRELRRRVAEGLTITGVRRDGVG